jgi:GT2 family glycosyltransferase
MEAARWFVQISLKLFLIHNQENAGFARATNQAIQSSESKYVLLLNPDTVVLPDALQQLVEFMDTHPEAGAAGSRVLNPDGSLQTSCYVAPTLAHEFFRLFHLSRFSPASTYQMKNWNTNIPRLVDIIQGDCLMLRKTALNQVGLLDERFFIYSEDVDLCYRLQRASWGLYWVPLAQVIHYGGQSTRQLPLRCSCSYIKASSCACGNIMEGQRQQPTSSFCYLQLYPA